MFFYIYRLICLALAGSVGMTLVILACALQQYEYVDFRFAFNQLYFIAMFLKFTSFFSSWWPFTVVLFYVLSVFPTIAARRFSQDSFTGTSPCLELSIFITMGFLISSFALPIVLNRAGEVSRMSNRIGIVHSCIYNFLFLKI